MLKVLIMCNWVGNRQKSSQVQTDRTITDNDCASHWEIEPKLCKVFAINHANWILIFLLYLYTLLFIICSYFWHLHIISPFSIVRLLRCLILLNQILNCDFTVLGIVQIILENRELLIILQEGISFVDEFELIHDSFEKLWYY